MSEVAVDLFVEDRGHEELVRALLDRLAREEQKTIAIRVRAASGGHGRVLDELDLYQKLMERGVTSTGQLLVVAVDANCQQPARKRAEVRDRLLPVLRPRAVIACPDPHVERWYMADPPSFARVVGATPRVGRRKCRRDLYKQILVDTISGAGHVPTLGGIEFGRDLVEAMDLYRAGRNEASLNAFVDAARHAIRAL
jgi:hypothetical protein